MINIKDTVTIQSSGMTIAKDGYLVGEAKVSRGGNVQQYYGAELGLTGDAAQKIFGVFRDPEVVFDETSMLSLAGRPVTRGHPPVGVNADNWKELTVGFMGGTVKRDGEHVTASMAIMDAAAVKEVMGGARGLSAGYTVDVTPEMGVTKDGEAYQYKQSGSLRFNHVAYLPDNNPRAGNTRIGDASNWGVAPIQLENKEEVHKMDTVTLVIGDKAVNVSAASAPLIEAFKADAAKSLSDMQASHTAKIVAKDEEIGTLKAEVAKLKADAITPEKLSAKIADRVALETAAKSIDPLIETTNLSDDDLRKAAVVYAYGDDMVNDSSPAEITGIFKALVRTCDQSDPFVSAVASGASKQVHSNDAWASFLPKEA